MNVYFEKLTLANIVVALVSLTAGKRVYYFETGRLFRKLPWMSAYLLRLFHRAPYQISESEGLGYEIHGAALEAAEAIYHQIKDRCPSLLRRWRKTFPSDLVHLYIKKTVAGEAWRLARDYLVLCRWVENGHPATRLVVTDTPLNRLLVPLLQARDPEPRVEIRGLSRGPARYLHSALDILLAASEVLARLPGFGWQRGITLGRPKQTFKVSKELIWGVGIGTGRRNDDFLVDSRLIQPTDILFYYRHSSAARMGQRKFLKESIDNAAARGYACVNFDRTPIPLAGLWRVLLPKYVLFPVFMAFAALIAQLGRPQAGLLNRIVMVFLTQSRGWDVFLESYAPRLNLSCDDPQAIHIAESIALNLHGLKNGGYQWSDLTTYRAVTQAYVGYDVYFAWGALPEKFWDGNWAVGRVVRTGYLWGHCYQDSLAQRELLRRDLLGLSEGRGHVVSLFDEQPDPDVYQSEAMLYDFYRVGVEILERRPDTVVVAKPKRFQGIPEVPEVLDLVAPYVASGRMKIWSRRSVDLWQVLAVSDVAVSMVMGTPHLEAVCCGKMGFSYAPTRNHASPIYTQGFGKVVFDKVDDLVDAIDRALDHPEENPWAGLESLITDIDPFRDFRGIDRMRSFISEICREAPPVPEAGAVGVAGSR